MYDAGRQLPRVVVDAVFEQRLADALCEPAVHLTFDDHRVDHFAEVVDRDEIDDVDDAGLGVDLDLGDVRAGRKREVLRVVERLFGQPRLDVVQRILRGDVRRERDLAERERPVARAYR